MNMLLALVSLEEVTLLEIFGWRVVKQIPVTLLLMQRRVRKLKPFTI